MFNLYVIHKPPPLEIHVNSPSYKPNYSLDTQTVNTCYFIVHFLVTIECGLFLLTRVFSVFALKKCEHHTLYEEPSILIVKKMYKIMSSSHGLSVLTVKYFTTLHKCSAYYRHFTVMAKEK